MEIYIKLGEIIRKRRLEKKMTMKELMNYRDEIKGLRAKHNITQEEAANLLGISRVSYKNKELGKTKFYYEEVIKLLMYLDELSYLTNSSTYFFTL